MQHDPNTIHNLVPTTGVEDPRHVAVFARQTELPGAKLAVEVTVLLLPLFYIRQRADVDRLL